RRLGEGIPDVEHVPLAAVPGERPGDFDRALIRPRRREQLTRPALLQALRKRPREAVVQQLDTLELAALDELAHEPSARHLAALQPAGSVFVWLAVEDQPPGPLREVVHEGGG